MHSELAKKLLAEIKPEAAPKPLVDNAVSPAIADALTRQKAQKEAKESRISKNGYYKGY